MANALGENSQYGRILLLPVVDRRWHCHLNEDETFHAIEGQSRVLADGQWHEVGAGGSALMPRGLVRTFKNAGDQPSRMLIRVTPSGFERFFGRCTEEFARPGGPNMSRIIEIGAEHGIHFIQ
jgi:quercetin dioxygenase-like cupin family protein